MQYPTILIAWFSFHSESINCKKVTSSLMSFRISLSLFLHIFILYCRFCSPFIFLLFFIIKLAKWFIFLKFSVCRFNYYSIIFTRKLTALMSHIKWKADAKLLKQQLFDDFWWYFISGASVRNCTFLVIFLFPIGTPNFWW